jgi:predicted tellurium resistance membrane protein TerC
VVINSTIVRLILNSESIKYLSIQILLYISFKRILLNLSRPSSVVKIGAKIILCQVFIVLKNGLIEVCGCVYVWVL